jgi:hypothetical protein
VDTCIHYDLPIDARTLALRLGAFLRYGRTKPFSSVVLRDVARSLTWEEALFQKLTSTAEP